MMSQDEALREFRDAGALLEGHFVLSSGLHSPLYLQCARVMMDPGRGERLCRALADKLRQAGLVSGIRGVVSPAMGGVVVGYEMARQLGLPEAIFFERVNLEFQLRRGFEIARGGAYLLVEDVVTTGLSSSECIAAVELAGGRVAAACALVDRSGGKADLGVPFAALISLDIPVFRADQIPAELQAIPAIKPGSRGLSVSAGNLSGA
jgi:orotate phosphoribosyltransferase